MCVCVCLHVMAYDKTKNLRVLLPTVETPDENLAFSVAKVWTLA